MQNGFNKESDQDGDSDGDLSASGSATRRRQIMFSKRKGLMSENSVEEKQPPKKPKSTRKQWKAIDFQFPKANYPKELLESLRMLPEAPKLEEPFAFRKQHQQQSTSLAKAGKDYPAFAEIPKTSFNCPEHLSSGVFADFETQCQMWHMCQAGRKHR